jgi:hypothetical protein
MHPAPGTAEAREEIREQRGDQHAAKEPVRNDAFEVLEGMHK